MKHVLAIDPGAGGGLAWIDLDGNAQALPMPEGMTAQIDAIRAIAASLPNLSAVLEKTGTYMPGNSGPASCTFARHCGRIEAALYTLGIPFAEIAPAQWMKKVGTLPKEKPARKAALKEFAARRYPHLSPTLKTSDALALLYVSTT